MKSKLNTPIGSQRYIRDHLFYGLRKPLQEAIHAKFHNPLNDYMALMRAPKKLRVNMNRRSITLPVLIDWVLLARASCTKREVPIMTLRFLIRSPDHNRLKCNNSWWQPLKGFRMHWKNPHNRGLIRVQAGPVRAPILVARDCNGRATAEAVAWTKQIRSRPGGSDQSQIQCYNCQGWEHMTHEWL